MLRKMLRGKCCGCWKMCGKCCVNWLPLMLSLKYPHRKNIDNFFRKYSNWFSKLKGSEIRVFISMSLSAVFHMK